MTTNLNVEQMTNIVREKGLLPILTECLDRLFDVQTNGAGHHPMYVPYDLFQWQAERLTTMGLMLCSGQTEYGPTYEITPLGTEVATRALALNRELGLI